MWWLVLDVKGERCVRLEEAPDLLQARFKASLSGDNGRFLEAHQLDRQTVKKLAEGPIRQDAAQPRRCETASKTWLVSAAR